MACPHYGRKGPGDNSRTHGRKGAVITVTDIDFNPSPIPLLRIDGANVTELTECSCTWRWRKRGMTREGGRGAQKGWALRLNLRLNRPRRVSIPLFGRMVECSATHHRHQLAPTIDSFRENVGYWVIIAGGDSSFSFAGSFSNQLLLRKDNDENQEGTIRECNSSSASVDVSKKIADTRISGLPRDWLHRFFRTSRRTVYHASPVCHSGWFVTIIYVWNNKLFLLLRTYVNVYKLILIIPFYVVTNE